MSTRTATPAQPARSSQPTRATGSTSNNAPATSASATGVKKPATTTTATKSTTTTTTSAPPAPTPARKPSTTTGTTAAKRPSTPTASSPAPKPKSSVTATTTSSSTPKPPATTSSSTTAKSAKAPPPPPPPTAPTANSSRAKTPARVPAATTSATRTATPAGAKSPAPKTSSGKTSSPKPSSKASPGRKPSPKGKSAANAEPEKPAEKDPNEEPKEEQEEKKPEPTEEELAKIREEEEKARQPQFPPEVVEARQKLSAKRQHLNELEISIQSMIYLMKVKTATERADSFKAKSTDIMIDVRKMKKEIDALRHADRAVSQLKDTLENMQRHQRMRNAHVRQKAATIALMEQRSKEYAALRRKMIYDLKDVVKDARDLAEAFEQGEAYAKTVDPWAALRSLVAIDDQREVVLTETVRRIAASEKEHVAALRTVIEAQKELATSVNEAANATAAELQAMLHEWDGERADLELQIAGKERAWDEVAHHLHRGTNFLWTSQLQRLDLRPLRELKLACDQHKAKLQHLNQHVSALEQCLVDEERNAKREVEELEGRINDAKDAASQVKKENDELRQEYAQLQNEYPMLPAPSIQLIAQKQEREENAGNHASSKRARSNGRNNNNKRSSPSPPNQNNANENGEIIISNNNNNDAESPENINKNRQDDEQEKFNGPSYMRPTNSRRKNLELKTQDHAEQQEKATNFRSRKPIQVQKIDLRK